MSKDKLEKMRQEIKDFDARLNRRIKVALKIKQLIGYLELEMLDEAEDLLNEIRAIQHIDGLIHKCK